MLAPLPVKVRVALRAGCLPLVVGALQLQGQRGLEGEVRAAADLEGAAQWRGLAAQQRRRPRDRHRFAAGRVEGEGGAIEANRDLADVERDALEDVGERIGDRPDLGGFGVYLQLVPDHHGAEVKGTGYGWGDYRQAQGGAL